MYVIFEMWYINDVRAIDELYFVPLKEYLTFH